MTTSSENVGSLAGACRRRAGRSLFSQPQNGFTLLELMIVISIILILVGMAVGLYQQNVRKAREAVLRQDLQTMRTAIDNYTLDKQQAPSSLQDLVDAHYLRQIPPDPVCPGSDWQVHIGDTVISPDQTGSGVDDVHSGCDHIGSNGSSYSSW